MALNRRIANGIQHVDWTGATTTNSHVFGASATITNSGGKTRAEVASMAAGSSFGTITDIASADMSAGDMVGLEIAFPFGMLSFAFRVIVSADPEAWNASPFGLGKYASVEVMGSQPKNGRYFLTIPKSEFAFNGGFVSGDWANIYHVQIWADKSAATVVNATEAFDLYGFHSGMKSRPAVLLAFDDSNDNTYAAAYLGTPHSNRGLPWYGFPATLYSIPSEFGTAGHADLADVQEMYEAGWDCAAHTVDPMAQVLSITWAAGVATATTVLPSPWNAHGFATSDVVPISGADPYELNGNKTVTVTGAGTFTFATTLGGSGTALGYIVCPWKEGASIGDTSVQEGIADNERDLLVGYGLTRGSDHFALANGVRTPGILAMLAGLGFQTIRTTDRMEDTTTPTGYSFSGGAGALKSLIDQWTGIGDRTQLVVVELNPNVTPAKVIAVIDQAIATGTALLIFGHLLVVGASVANEYEVDDFYEIMDALSSRRDDGDVDVMTVSQWFGSLDAGDEPGYFSAALMEVGGIGAGGGGGPFPWHHYQMLRRAA